MSEVITPHPAATARFAQARNVVNQLMASPIRQVANSAMGRSDVLPFWFGESDRLTAPFISQAAMQSLAQHETHYSENLGRGYLRQAIASYLSDLHQTPVDAQRIVVCGSGVSGLMLAAQLLLDPGDEVVAVTPLWPNLVEIPKILGARVTRFPLQVHQGRWSLDLDGLLRTVTAQTRMLLVNSPNNPTGWTLTEPELQQIIDHCRALGVWVVFDDVYQRLIYDTSKKVAPSSLPHYQPGDRIISINSFSKAWSMTGWRVGWLVVPDGLSEQVAKLIEYNTSCVFEPVQRAACAAVQQGEAEVAEMRALLAQTRTLLVNGLLEIPGVEAPGADGAMYVFFRLQGCTDSMQMALDLVREAGLGVAPGVAFGPEAEGWLRWCHATSPERLIQGLKRLQGFMARR